MRESRFDRPFGKRTRVGNFDNAPYLGPGSTVNCECTDGSHPCRQRNSARASEIAGMRADDLDWALNVFLKRIRMLLAASDAKATEDKRD